VPATLTFTATTVDGQPFDAASVAGKPVVLWFWAAWCPRCRAAASGVAAVHREFGGSVTMLGVAGLNSGASAMRDFVRDRGIDGFTNLADDDGAIWRKFGVTAQEYFVLLDASGAVVYKGLLGTPDLRQRVSNLKG
jgi:peroxiredoxin